MKNLFITAIVMSILLSPVVAKAEGWADNFNDGVKGSQWVEYPDGASNARFLESPTGDNGVLNFTVGTLDPDNNEGWVNYELQQQTLNFSKDFGFKAQFLNTTSPGEGTSTGLDIGLMRNSNPASFAYGSAYNDWDGTATKRRLGAFIDVVGGGAWESGAIDQTSGNTWIGLDYTVKGDVLRFGTSPDGSTWDIYATKTGFTAEYGSDSAYPFLCGWSDGVVVTTGQMSFDNFGGDVAPEPVSSALFIVGGVALALRKIRKNKVI